MFIKFHRSSIAAALIPISCTTSTAIFSKRRQFLAPPAFPYSPWRPMASLRRSASARSAPWSRLDRASLASSGLFTETLTSQRGSSRWSSRTRSSSLSPKSKGHGR